ncbi:hypothetical protein PMNALOAF_2717 [Methylobacterium adhaesivum]|nr:hypothetical protein PMNALOAF_2717 [Methylobacterium adhaesivum]
MQNQDFEDIHGFEHALALAEQLAGAALEGECLMLSPSDLGLCAMVLFQTVKQFENWNAIHLNRNKLNVN